ILYFSIDTSTSFFCDVSDASVARIKCSLVVPLVKPKIDPRTSLSQYGAPKPTNAGTTYTPSVDSTRLAYSSLSGEYLNILKPSRNHCIAEPATKMLPSNAYSTLPSSPQAIVVSSPFFDLTGVSPVFINMKQPVPYVFLTMPSSKHACPNKAAC